MDVRTVVLTAAIGLVALGCSEGPSSSAGDPDPATTEVAPGTPSSGTASPADAASPAGTPSSTDAVPATSSPADATRPRALVAAAPGPPTDDAEDGGPGGGADPADGEPVDRRRVAEVQVGECLTLAGWPDPDLVELVEATVVGCDEAHHAEVFARVSLDDDPDAAHPGDEHVASAADRVCFERFEPYVGMRYVDARLEIVHLRPPEAAWLRGDRTVVCVLVNASGEPLVGSMAGDR